jgi:hypothetical protein
VRSEVSGVQAGMPIAPSSYYAAKTRPPSARAVADECRLEVIRAVHAHNYGVYGVRKTALPYAAVGQIAVVPADVMLGGVPTQFAADRRGRTAELASNLADRGTVSPQGGDPLSFQQ